MKITRFFKDIEETQSTFAPPPPPVEAVFKPVEVKQKKKVKVKFNVGDLCAAYIDHHWWRVTVTHTDAFEYEVLLLDSGCRRRAPKRNVYPLFGFNRYSSPLVIRVSLGVYPPSILG